MCQKSDEWDIEGAASEMYDELDGASPEDCTEDEFIGILAKYEA